MIGNVRGCEFGTGANGVGCTERIWKLGDIFHSNPVVVPGPSAFLFSPSYRAFYSTYETRDRVIVAGANDGFLRGFLAGVWDAGATPAAYDHGTGEELFGYMPWPGRQNEKDFPNDGASRDVYFVDGKAFSIGDQLSFQDMAGNELAFIRQKLLSWGPTYEIHRNGEHYATIKKELFTLFRTKFQVDIPGPHDLRVEGDFLHHEYARARAEFKEALKAELAFHQHGTAAEIERECQDLITLFA